MLGAASDVSLRGRREIGRRICNDRNLHFLLLFDKIAARLRARDLLGFLSFFTSRYLLDRRLSVHSIIHVLLITKLNLHLRWSVLLENLLI